MVRKKNPANEKLLTEVELELMRILWDRGEGTVRDILDGLPEERDLAYTSVATMMKILEKKKVVVSRKNDHVHTYRPLLARTEYESTTIQHLTRNVFRGDPSSLVMKLLHESDLSTEDLQAIQKLLQERMGS